MVSRNNGASCPRASASCWADVGAFTLTVKQAAAYAVVSEPTVRRWIRSKALPVYRAGKQLRIALEDLINFL